MVGTLENPIAVAHKQRVPFLVIGPDARYPAGVQAGSKEFILAGSAALVAVPHRWNFLRSAGG